MRNSKTVIMYNLLGLFTLVLFFNAEASHALAQENPSVLARVQYSGMVDQIGLPVYAHLQDINGVDYAIVISTTTQMDALKTNYQVLDTLTATVTSTSYLIALERVKGTRANAANTVNILYDDGKHIIAKANEKQAESLATMGFEVKRLRNKPIDFTKLRKLTVEKTVSVVYDPTIQDMINTISQSNLNTYVGNLSGEWPVNVGGSDYTISSRHTSSGTPIQKATQYVYEFMQGLGLTVSYHDWTYGSYSNRNVIGEKTGTVVADEILLVIAHLDCMPSGSLSYGADDNVSGSVGVMALAEALSAYNFERTIRFVLFTGEEQGLYGSNRYADLVSGENIVAVYNMDMIAWDSVGDPTLRLHTRSSSNPGYSADREIADIFIDVVSIYGMSSLLTPIIDADGITTSDHSSFWDEGFVGILAIEDDVDDFCDYYHTINDRLSTLNMTYFTSYVKASVGTIAHLAYLPVNGPRAGFTYSINDLEVSFTDASTNATGTNVAWYWDFGDGNNSSDPSPTHTYSSYATYSVELTVTDDSSLSDSTNSNVQIEEPKGYCGAAPTQIGAHNNMSIAAVSVHRAFIPLFLAILIIVIGAFACKKRRYDNK